MDNGDYADLLDLIYSSIFVLLIVFLYLLGAFIVGVR